MQRRKGKRKIAKNAQKVRRNRLSTFCAFLAKNKINDPDQPQQKKV